MSTAASLLSFRFSPSPLFPLHMAELEAAGSSRFLATDGGGLSSPEVVHRQQLVTLLAANAEFAHRLENISEIQTELSGSAARLQETFASPMTVASRVDEALIAAPTVLAAIQADASILNGVDPQHDLQQYLNMVGTLERRTLVVRAEVYHPWLEKLEELIMGFFNEAPGAARWLDITKLSDAFAEVKNLDSPSECLRAALQKLEGEFARLLAENSVGGATHLVDIGQCVKVLDASSESMLSALAHRPALDRGVIDKLRSSTGILSSHGRLDGCLRHYKESRVATLRKALEPEYLRFCSSPAQALNEMEWEEVRDYARSWWRHLKVIIKVLLAQERELCYQVFHTVSGASDDHDAGDYAEPWVKHFSEIVQGCEVASFFKLSELVATHHHHGIAHRPGVLLVALLELLQGIDPDMNRDMDRAFAGCMDLEALASFKANYTLLPRSNMMGLVCKSFWEFADTIDCHQLQVAIQNGGEDFNTTFVVRFMGMLVTDYGHIMAEALALVEADLPSAALCVMNALGKSLEAVAAQSCADDPILAHLFLMNNYKQVLVCVKECTGLKKCLGDDWCEKWKNKVDFNIRGYLSKSWNQKVLVHISKDDSQALPIHDHHHSVASRSKALMARLHIGSRNSCRDAVKVKLYQFNEAFEEAIKVQRRWVILHPPLREHVRSAIAQFLVPTYQNFLQSYGPLLDDHRHRKAIRYDAYVLQTMVGDLFNDPPTKI